MQSETGQDLSNRGGRIPIQIEHGEGNSPRWTTNTGIGGIKWPLPITDEGREVRGTYQSYAKGDKTKTSNAAISEACHQVAVANQAIFLDEARFSDALARHPTAQMPFRTKVLIPTVVTSAELKVCEFDPNDVDASSGELSYDKVSVKHADALVYEYPLPRQLQNLPRSLASTLLDDGLESFVRMHILIVHSAILQDFLRLLQDTASEFGSLSFHHAQGEEGAA